MVARSVLIVEGDWKIRKLIRTNLEARGLEIAEVNDGSGSLQAIKSKVYDLILIGADLPDANGWNIVGQMRRELAGLQTPIVVITAEPADKRLLRRFSRVSQLVQPFSALSLLQEVERAMSPKDQA